MLSRSLPWKFGADYQGALELTRSALPSRGQGNGLPDPNWDRELGFVSQPELEVAVHALYANVTEYLENRLCCPVPGAPILSGHPLVGSRPLPSSSGTARIAAALGIAHPMALDDRSAEVRERDGARHEFFPLTIDGMAILPDGDTVRAVGLFVRASHHELPREARDIELFQLASAYCAESKIPLRMITPDQLNPVVTTNLKLLVQFGRKPRDLPDSALSAALAFMQARVFSTAPVTWRQELFEQFGLVYEQVFHIFHYGVFRRHLLVDLERAVQMNAVHQPERLNYAADFAAKHLEPL